MFGDKEMKEELKTLNDLPECNIAIIHTYPIGDTVSVSETPVGCNILIENKDKIVFEKGYFTSDLKAEAVKRYKKNEELAIEYSKEGNMYWEGIHKGACFELKNFFNLTEKDLEDLQ